MPTIPTCAISNPTTSRGNSRALQHLRLCISFSRSRNYAALRTSHYRTTRRIILGTATCSIHQTFRRSTDFNMARCRLSVQIHNDRPHQICSNISIFSNLRRMSIIPSTALMVHMPSRSLHRVHNHNLGSLEGRVFLRVRDPFIHKPSTHRSRTEAINKAMPSRAGYPWSLVRMLTSWVPPLEHKD